jgi:hypothetical protein
VKRDKASEQDQLRTENQLPGFFSAQALFDNSQAACDENNFTSPSTTRFATSSAYKVSTEDAAAGGTITNELNQAYSREGQETNHSGEENSRLQSDFLLPQGGIVFAKEIEGNVFRSWSI